MAEVIDKIEVDGVEKEIDASYLNGRTLENVDNTSDMDKPISTKVQEALNSLNSLITTLETKVNTNEDDIEGKVATINTTINSIKNDISAINTILTSNDTDLDTLQELVNALKSNVASINDIFTQLGKKVDKTTTVNGYPLSSNVTLGKSDVGLGNVLNVESYSKSESDSKYANKFTVGLNLELDDSNDLHVVDEPKFVAVETNTLEVNDELLVDGFEVLTTNSFDRTLITNGVIEYGKNLNDYKSNGIYRLQTGVTNQPSDTDFGTMIVFRNTIDTGFQIVSGYNQGTLYYRGFNNDGFDVWCKLSGFDNPNDYGFNYIDNMVSNQNDNFKIRGIIHTKRLAGNILEVEFYGKVEAKDSSDSYSYSFLHPNVISSLKGLTVYTDENLMYASEVTYYETTGEINKDKTCYGGMMFFSENDGFVFARIYDENGNGGGWGSATLTVGNYVKGKVYYKID